MNDYLCLAIKVVKMGYKENRSADVTENLDHYFDQLSPYEQGLFIKKLEKMVEKNQIKT